LGEGGIEEASRKAEFNIRVLDSFAKRGIDIVTPLPTCSLMLKREYPTLLPGEASRRVADHTFDICEYLMKIHSAGELNLAFTKPGKKIIYQIPCHLRDQNIGLKSRDLMRLIPGSSVDVIERCSGIDGTWGMKSEYFELSLTIGKKLFSSLEDAQPAIAASDCGLACQQIRQGTGLTSLHPIEIVRMAYGD
jgi:glycerol-3-phosphate dehydrogenase subunit C